MLTCPNLKVVLSNNCMHTIFLIVWTDTDYITNMQNTLYYINTASPPYY